MKFLRIPVSRRFGFRLFPTTILALMVFILVNLQQNMVSSPEVIVNYPDGYTVFEKATNVSKSTPHPGRHDLYVLRHAITDLRHNLTNYINLTIELQAEIQRLKMGIQTPVDKADQRNTKPATVPSPKPSQDLLLLTAEEKCFPSSEEKKSFVGCESKMKWFMGQQKLHQCYHDYGVNRSVCSYRKYLSEVESECPLLPGRERKQVIALQVEPPETEVKVAFNVTLNGLLTLLRDPDPSRLNYEFLRRRVIGMWPGWTGAAQALLQKQPELFQRPTKQIFIFIGLMSKDAKLNFVENQFKGAPLGEFVQWTDIIASHYVLGHRLTITSELHQLRRFFSSASTEQPCPAETVTNTYFDMFYTDIIGYKLLRKVRNLKATIERCKVRLIDSFGTEAEFNLPSNVQKQRGMSPAAWGALGLKLKQFYTLYPHSPDNSFMGFVISNRFNASQTSKRKRQALVYGKKDYMWKGSRRYLDIIHDYVEIHGTVHADGRNPNIPPYVINHGILNSQQLYRELEESKIFIGLGFPFEGPAPLEAIAHGCVFLNPSFNPPKNSKNTEFFKNKPNVRALTSQNPYVEEYIGEPHVITLDVNNETQVREAVEKALNSHGIEQVKPYIPYEFTEEGMLQRVDAFVHKQDFCDPQAPLWPPEGAISVEVSKLGQSCKELCHSKGKICEPTHFPRLDNKETIESHVPKPPDAKGTACHDITRLSDPWYPAYNPSRRACILQGEPMLYSCVGAATNLRRVCPCRDFIPQQTALCEKCL